MSTAPTPSQQQGSLMTCQSHANTSISMSPSRPTLHHVNYHLHVDKAMRNKMDACNRSNPIEIAHTEGGIRVFCQAAIYELLRTKVHSIYTEQGKNHPDTSITQTKDAQDAVVAETYKIKYRSKHKSVIYCKPVPY